MKTTFIRLSGIIPLCIGIYLILHAGGNLLESYTISIWPSVEGKVLSSKIISFKRHAGSKFSHPIPMAKVEYTYEVKGIAYTSSRISFNDYGSNIKDQQQKIIDRYPLSKQVKVLFNPKKHESSILEHRTPIMHYIKDPGSNLDERT